MLKKKFFSCTSVMHMQLILVKKGSFIEDQLIESPNKTEWKITINIELNLYHCKLKIERCVVIKKIIY